MVVDNFLGSAAARAVREGIQQLDVAGCLRKGKIQHGARQDKKVDARTDRIGFLPRLEQILSGIGESKEEAAAAAKAGASTIPLPAVSAALRAYAKGVDGIRERLTAQPGLVERVQGGLDGCNLMCAVYPGGGAFYVKHRDALPYKAGRKVTVIYYLNAGWEEGHGGELRIWPSDAPETGPVLVQPLEDRLLLFVSSLEHEVLPAWRPRFALTTWMFNRKDTALEVFAEEIRERKASGKFDTQALLASIEAAESSDEGDGAGESSASSDDDDENGVSKSAAMSVMLMLMKRKQERAKAEAAARRAKQPGGDTLPEVG